MISFVDLRIRFYKNNYVGVGENYLKRNVIKYNENKKKDL